MSTTPNGAWQKNPALAWREIDDETVIISPTENVMHELNETGSFLWKNIDGRKSVAELAEMLAAEYEVTPGAALVDTEALLQQLAANKLLVPAGTASAEASR